MKPLLLLIGISVLMLLNCSSENGENGSDSDSDTDNDSDTDTDADTDTDTDTDTDIDTDTDTDGDCNAVSPDADEYLWYDSYENDPWYVDWGLEWDQETNHEITASGVLFGDSAAQVTYPEGTYSSAGGAQYRQQFDLLDPPVPASESMYVRYFVKFDENIDFIRGGKLPGLVGGEGNTGGDPPDGYDGFSARIMWRANGRIVQYVYHIDQPTEFGEDMDWDEGGGPRFFIPGQWHCVETFLQMNTVSGGEGDYNGVVRSWFDGELALDRTDVRFRHTEDLQIDGLYFSTFFGGGDASWAPVKDETAMFDNFVISNEPIGCRPDCDIPEVENPGPDPIEIGSADLVFNSDDEAWDTGSWSAPNSIKDFDNAKQNHTAGGSESAYILFSDSDWDAAVFSTETPFDPSDYTHVYFWIMPEGAGTIFRLQFRGAENSADVVVDGSPTYHTGLWNPGTWQEVAVPIEKFSSVAGQTDLLVRSDNETGSHGFWIDDINLVVAK